MRILAIRRNRRQAEQFQSPNVVLHNKPRPFGGKLNDAKTCFSF